MNYLSSEAIKSLSNPLLIKISAQSYAAKFDLMKFTPAKRILDEALACGRLKEGGEVIESSSGTFALALALLSSFYGLRLTLVTGPVSPIVRWRLESLGAKLHVVPSANNCEGGIQQARLHVLHRLLEEHPQAFWPQQYTNPLNSLSYGRIADNISKEIPRIDTIVASVGSGGSLFGMARFLRANRNPQLKVVAVDHNRSVIFGAEPKHITKMCRETFEQLLAMGAGIPMGNVEFEACDVIHWTPIPLMVQQVHRFHQTSGFMVGPSSGAVLAVAEWEAKQNPHKTILSILPDHGMRYIDTMFNPEWLSRWPDDMARTWTSPSEVKSPRHVVPDWCMYRWNRSSFSQVLGHLPVPRPADFDPQPLPVEEVV